MTVPRRGGVRTRLLANAETAADLPRCRSSFSKMENQRVFNEVWVPFSLRDLPEDETLSIDDTAEYIEYLTEKWPPGGRPHRVQHYEPGVVLPPGRRKPAPGTDGWVVFRIPVPTPEPDPTAPVVDWDSVLRERTRDRPED